MATLRDPQYLGWCLNGLVAQFGRSVLDDPVRLRNLLRDEYGSTGRDSSDIDVAVSTLTSI